MKTDKVLKSLLSLVFGLVFLQDTQAQKAETFVKSMYAKNSKNWYRTLTFTQDTEFYRGDSIFRKSVWYEMVRFPFELRIDVDSIAGGNKTIYKKDSTYRIRNHKLAQAGVDHNPFIFFLGGMYLLPPDSVFSTLKKEGYDVSKGISTNWNGRKTFIVGANNPSDSTSNQFWVDEKDLYIVRVITKLGKDALDVHLSNHVKLKKGWSETYVRFYLRGKLIQTERYRDIKTDVELPDEVFNVDRYR